MPPAPAFLVVAAVSLIVLAYAYYRQKKESHAQHEPEAAYKPPPPAAPARQNSNAARMQPTALTNVKEILDALMQRVGNDALPSDALECRNLFAGVKVGGAAAASAHVQLARVEYD
ncbi:hypothetical protein SPRG_14934 [Saprolegnia parasitica CBS 223.65]|uniref:Uncharacterized protein n=1 Tax=Saprolegnia parasitica (strain CBS 223.65) TaxID=695850 RepID=A0A067BMX2_SAPPC|nr:hypothetical protein SPRG_14934 [Saprolegnia parasitica CBS 223.65]KDO19834.1 hypothetical protein SPRG_14934 [Saprolegnia parasitica CBS 223.65]|eukprot:XP_012209446.1 hypothetical protein SPRG_14934 [Saprolegnia parasitica CBS 223.65]